MYYEFIQGFRSCCCVTDGQIGRYT